MLLHLAKPIDNYKMTKNETIKGLVFIALGATCYGLLATLVKLSYKAGFITTDITGSQFLLGVIGMLFIRFFSNKNNEVKATPKNKKNLILAGTTMGMTSVFYYICVKYLDASIAIVLLMQSVWIGVVLESILTKKRPENRKLFTIILVIAGTVLATNTINNYENINAVGVFWGLLAAVSFTITMHTANSIANNLSHSLRSIYMLLGGSIIVLVFAIVAQQNINLEIIYTYGIPLALFGTILPPLFLNAGFPKTGLGLGSIVSSLELPISVTFSYLVLNETVLPIQWIGIFVIIGAIIYMNSKYLKR